MANTYKALATVTATGSAGNIVFSNIPQTYTDLKLVMSIRSTTSGSVGLQGWFNSYGTTMSFRTLGGNGTTTSTNSGSFGVFSFVTMNDSGTTANTCTNLEMYIPNYASASSQKSFSIDSAQENNATTAYIDMVAGLNQSTSPITSITLGPSSGNFAANSTFTLYGVFNADVSSAPATPTIGSATAGNTQASITFTPVSNAASYTMTSTPGSITATGTSSPITVTGLTNETAYTFKVKSNNPFGSSAESAASNSVTPSTAVYESIATATVGAGGTSTITFNSIPQSYTHLQIRFYATGSGGNIPISFNSSGGGYSWQYNGSNGSTTSNSNSGSGGVSGTFICHAIAANTNWTAGVCDITEYTNTSKAKTFRSITGYSNNTTNGNWFLLNQGIWNNTSAITRIDIGSATLAEGTRFALYGIRS